jgi:ATP-dependent helicase HrpA
VYRFYAARLLARAVGRGGAPRRGGVSSVGELVDLVRERRGAEPRFPDDVEPDDLRDPETIQHDAAAFPEALPLENRALPLNYAYKPGQADDGVTLDVNVREAEALTPAALDWAVPGHLEAKVEHYLRALPKELRRGFVPLAETARSWRRQVARATGSRIGASRCPRRWRRMRNGSAGARSGGVGGQAAARSPARARPGAGCERRASWRESRAGGNPRGAPRSRARRARGQPRSDPPAWRAARARWETPEHTTWNFDPQTCPSACS